MPDIKDYKVILDRVMVEIEEKDTGSVIVTEIRDRLDAIKYAKVLSVGDGDIIKGANVKVGDRVIIDHYDSIVAPDPDNPNLRILEWHEILGVVDNDN
jgi:co-chaperonin GroES (HSP10)